VTRARDSEKVAGLSDKIVRDDGDPGRKHGLKDPAQAIDFSCCSAADFCVTAAFTEYRICKCENS
jgi:hypothetical protein